MGSRRVFVLAMLTLLAGAALGGAAGMRLHEVWGARLDKAQREGLSGVNNPTGRPDWESIARWRGERLARVVRPGMSEDEAVRILGPSFGEFWTSGGTIVSFAEIDMAIGVSNRKVTSVIVGAPH